MGFAGVHLYDVYSDLPCEVMKQNGPSRRPTSASKPPYSMFVLIDAYMEKNTGEKTRIESQSQLWRSLA